MWEISYKGPAEESIRKAKFDNLQEAMIQWSKLHRIGIEADLKLIEELNPDNEVIEAIAADTETDTENPLEIIETIPWPQED